MTEIRVPVPPELIDAIAARAAELVRGHLDAATSPYLTVIEAADRARCERQRIYDLLSAGRLTRYRDGRRVLVLRDELDAYLAGDLQSPPGPSRLRRTGNKPGRRWNGPGHGNRRVGP